MSKNIIEQTRIALLSRRGSWREVADKSGVSYSWISKFMNGHIPNPGTRTLSRLLDGVKSIKATSSTVKEANHA